MRLLLLGLVPALAVSTLAPLAAQRRPFGTGCTLDPSSPPLLFVAGEPVTGRDVDVLMLPPGGSAPAALLVGFSDRWFGSTPLPLALDRFGLPGCELLVSADIVEPFASGPVLSLPTRVLGPGARFYLQGTTLDTAGSLDGFTRGIEVTMPDPFAPFAIAMLPDTQEYTEIPAWFRHFIGQVDDVAQRAASTYSGAPVRFTVQIGDIVQRGASVPAEWDRAVTAMTRLDGVTPWTVCLGNHDYDTVGDKASATRFVANFGIPRNSAQPGYLGSTADGRNHWQVFGSGPRRFLHLALEWRPRDVVLEAAQEVLAAHRDLPCIVSTHEHLDDGPDPSAWRTGGSTPEATGDNDAESVFRKLCEPFPNVFLVMCGHVGGTGRRTDTTALGESVHQMLADYQFDVEGGNGFYRLLEMDARASLVRVSSTSATYVSGNGPDYRNDPEHNYPLAYDEIAHRDRLTTRGIRWFRDGQDLGRGAAYAGTRDTFVGNGGGTGPNDDRGDADDVWCDGDQSRSQGLLRFDDLFGTGPGQIPPGTVIRRATLTLTFEGANAASGDGGRLHRMVVPWTERSTWNSLGDGIQLGSEALSGADADTAGAVANRGTRSFDVTTSLNAWSFGAPNHGWAVFANGPDGQSFRSSDWAGVAERPLLTVTW